MSRVIGISEKVIDETADDVCGFHSASMVSFLDFQMLYFEIFSRVQPEPDFSQHKGLDYEVTDCQQTDYDMLQKS